jgi:tRNA pseudouridine38-40 synthase
MARYALLIEYDGTPYIGWQYQNEGLSIQGQINEAIYKFCQEKVSVMGSGRTDAGVHARGQIAHVDLEQPQDPFRLMEALNAYLRRDAISILKVWAVPDTFHARFSAVKRCYEYLILNRRAPAALQEQRVWHVVPLLDIEAMQAGANHLLGHHDFTSFRAVECQAKSPVKTLERLSVTKDADLISIQVESPSFLHHQVRNITGTLKLVGAGKLRVADVKTILEAKDRKCAGPTAPAAGLYLSYISYKDDK